MTETAIQGQPVASGAPLRPADCAHRVRLLMSVFDLSLGDVCAGCGRAISRSQLHRILHGHAPSAFEKRAISTGILTCLQRRCADSAFLFGE
jgi:hypothetical protein